MEDLTKQQIILLCLLLSFVTSIGTGIITASLLEQAPERVTQTINKVVERTVENVLPTETTIKETETVTRIVVSSDDVIADAISKVEKSLVRVFNVAGEIQEFSAIGVIVEENGLVAVADAAYIAGFKYVGEFGDQTYDLALSEETGTSGIVYLAPQFEEDAEIPVFTKADISSKASLGQSIINVGGSLDTTIQTGLISKISTEELEDGSEIAIGFSTSFDSATLGSLIINYSGELIGYNNSAGILSQNKQFMFARELIPDESTDDLAVEESAEIFKEEVFDIEA